MISGRIVDVDSPNCTVSVDEVDLTVDCRTNLVEGTLTVGDDVSIGVRFEAIEIGESVSADNVYDATVSNVVFKGNVVDTTVRIEGIDTEFQITDLNAEDTHVFDRGDGVRIGWDETDCLLYTA